MADEDDEFFEAFEDLPPSPQKAQKAAVVGPLTPELPRAANDDNQSVGRERSRTTGERNPPASTSSQGDVSQDDAPTTRERAATLGSAPVSRGLGFRDADLSVWKSGPSSVRERRERFWQSQGGGPLAGASSFGGANLPPPAGSLPGRRVSAVQGRVSGTEGDLWQGAKIEKRRSSEGERRLTIGFDSKPQQNEQPEVSPKEALPPPVAFVVSSQGSTPINGAHRGASGLTNALADHVTPGLKKRATSDPLPKEGRPRAETAPALYKIGDILGAGVSVLPPRAPSHSPDSSESVTRQEIVPESRFREASPSQPISPSSVQTASQSEALPSSLPGGQSAARPFNSAPIHTVPDPPAAVKSVTSPAEAPPGVQPVKTEKARPWPKRHLRTPSGSDPDTQPPSGGASPTAPKSPLLHGMHAAKHLWGQVANHLTTKGGNKSPNLKAKADGSPDSNASTELERDVLRLGGASEAESQPPGSGVRRSLSEQVGASTPPGASVAVDLVYRIKNLDTGKEFLLEQAPSTGGESKVKDVNSGKELSMDDVEESLGLSPVMREVRRREMLAKGGEDAAWEDGSSRGARAEAESDPGSGGVAHKKKKGWLNKALKTGAAYYGKGRRKFQRDADTEGSGSDTDRRPFVHGRGFMDARVAGWGPGYEAGPNGKGSVKVHVQKKPYKELTDVRVGQEIKAHEGPIWCMKFNSDGRFLATGGKDGLVKVWEVVDKLPPTPLQANGDFDELVSTSGRYDDDVIGDVSADNSRRASRDRSNSWGASFWLADVAYRTFKGHTSDVLELSWSKNTQFLLSSSMDTTVRLWHVSMNECLRVFPHSDFVTCLDFNPVDDKYFISGSLDNKIRIWNIPEHRVVDWTDMREMVTACTYTGDGSGAIVGSYEGTCRFYNTSKHMLQLDGTLDVRSTRGKNARGKKVTGVECMPGDPRKILVTSNDSRLRVYDGMKLHCKYRGHANANSQKAASFSASGDFLVCPSEDGFVYVWSSVNSYVPPYGGFRRDRHQSCEYFYSHAVNVAVAWLGSKAGSSDHDGGEKKARSRHNSAGNAALKGEITSVGGLRVAGKSAREVPPGSWPKEALGARGELKGPVTRNGPGPWAEPREDSEGSESSTAAVSEALAAGEGVVAAAAGLGLVIVTASYQGEIRTFKNFGRPVWL